MLAIRPAESSDYPIIATFPQSEDELFFMFPSGTYPLRPEQLEDNSRSRWCPTVVTVDGRPAGFANIYGYVEDSHCSLGNVIVAPSHRGTGVARFLIEAMLERARTELNVSRVLLACHHTNPRGLLFYNKLGFKPYGMSKMTNPRNETIVAIQMELLLQPPVNNEL